METFDLVIAYTWEYDQDLVESIESIFQAEGLSTFIVRDFNLDEVIKRVSHGEIFFKAFFDRASDEDDNFLELAKLLAKKGTYIINPINKTRIAIDKSKMHRKLVKAKVRVPYTFILPSYYDINNIKIKPITFEKLGIPFIIKPALYSGGGQAVNVNAKTFEDIQEMRQQIPQDKFLLQKKVYPPNNGKRRLWFRCYYFFGLIIPVWWDDQTHLYDNISKTAFKKFQIYKLISLTRKLAKISGLDYFSTEATLDSKMNFILIDYINDQCDFRFKSKHANGVPDRVIKFFIKSLAKKIQRLK